MVYSSDEPNYRMPRAEIGLSKKVFVVIRGLVVLGAIILFVYMAGKFGTEPVQQYCFEDGSCKAMSVDDYRNWNN